ncbi:MAG: endonuclease III domain-containing protein [Candidatus Omnitrophica bacterium]|nr:endonuclease III domain-containing protein [Candidatus Omnitrophota bacterium]
MGWWPADTPFEVMVGAILTQNTAWTNVEKAIVNLKNRRVLKPASMARLEKKRLARLIRPAGYYNIKAKRLKNFLRFFLKEFNGSLKKFLSQPTDRLRERLLEVNGIGPETADSIILYAADRPVFVVDAYTKRVFSRHRIIGPRADYHNVQTLFMENLPRRARLFNEYHALIVKLAKVYCKKIPLCGSCPLKGI